jgi:sortase A
MRTSRWPKLLAPAPVGIISWHGGLASPWVLRCLRVGGGIAFLVSLLGILGLLMRAGDRGPQHPPRPARGWNAGRIGGGTLIAIGSVALAAALTPIRQLPADSHVDARSPRHSVVARADAGKRTAQPNVEAMVPDPPIGPSSHVERRAPTSGAVRDHLFPFPAAIRRLLDGLGNEASPVGASAATTPTTQPAAIIMPPPDHISIPAVGIDTAVTEVAATDSEIDGQVVFEWQVADWVAGHHATSANPGEQGNIVIAGHDDVRGEVFRGLHDIAVGDDIIVSSAAGTFNYRVAEVHLRLYEGASLEDRVAVGVFAGPMPEERLTLITCWPYQVDTHRLIVVAKPV